MSKHYAFVYDTRNASYMRQSELKTTVTTLADSGYIASTIPPNIIPLSIIPPGVEPYKVD